MKPLICPQCGGKINEYDNFRKFAECKYCETSFLIEREPIVRHAPPPVDFASSSDDVPTDPGITIVFAVLGGAALLIVGIVIVGVLGSKKSTTEIPRPTPARYTPTTGPREIAAPPANYENLLDFGGKGTGNGLFKDATSVAVDSKGRIYVADETLRVQQFNEKGEFLRVWQIPETTKYYKKARTIQKIAVDKNDRLYVLVAGVIQYWEQNTIELPEMTFHAPPDFIVDFALRADGGLLMVAVNNEIEEFIFLAANGKVMKRINGLHTETADAALSPRDTALAAIRVAVDGAGNIFSTYAFGDLGSYQLSYNAEELMIFRYTPQGKYVDKFVQTMDSVGIEIDNQSRVYISRGNALEVHKADGTYSGIVDGFSRIDAFGLDSKNNIYVIADDRVIKRAALPAAAAE